MYVLRIHSCFFLIQIQYDTYCKLYFNKSIESSLCIHEAMQIIIAFFWIFCAIEFFTLDFFILEYFSYSKISNRFVSIGDSKIFSA